jgi:hypothetical protein
MKAERKSGRLKGRRLGGGGGGGVGNYAGGGGGGGVQLLGPREGRVRWGVGRRLSAFGEGRCACW